VLSTNPPRGASVALPLQSIEVTFDQPMFAGGAAHARSVTHPANYQLRRSDGSSVAIQSVVYDAVRQTAIVQPDPLTTGS
jgi:hypothetical protein